MIAQARPASHQSIGVQAGYADMLVATAGAADEPDGARRDLELVRQEPDQGGIRGPVDRRRGNPDAQLAVLHALDPISPAAGRQANREPQLAVAQRRNASRITVRTMMTIIGERSSIPIGGRTRRTGARIGSVAW